MPKVSESKKKIVKDIEQASKDYPIMGVVNMENLPAPQLQTMRANLRDKVSLFMTKKTLMRLALDKIKNDKKGIGELEKYFDGMPALIFTKDSPFRLSRILKRSKTAAPAKAGQTAPNDIIIKKGPTPFAPGPVISELSSIGLQVGVEGGKVAVKEDSVVAKKGEKIKPKVAEVLTRLDIKPMEVGLDLVAAYEEGIIYNKDVLDIDEQQYIDNVNLAALQAFNLAFSIAYITKDNAPLLIGKAFREAKAVGLSGNIIDSGIIEDLLANAERSMISLKGTANIETASKETKPEEKQKPEVKEEKKDEKKETPKPKEELKAEPTPELKKPVPEVKEPEPETKEQPKESKVDEKKPEPNPVKEEMPKESEVKEINAEKPETKPQEKPKTETKETPEPVQKTHPEKVEKKPAPKEEIEKKVEKLVEKTKKFAKGGGQTAQDIIEEVKDENEAKEKEAHDPKKEKEEKEQKEVEDLTKELLRKGTLRK
jgi:large subunit ribosomal protein L10